MESYPDTASIGDIGESSDIPSPGIPDIPPPPMSGYDSTGMENNYLFSCGMDDNHRGICFIKDEKTTRVYGAVGYRKHDYMDISNFPTSYYNPCRKDRWNLVCVVYDTISYKSSLWVNHGKICDFACRLPLKPSTLNLFNRVVHFDDSSGFNGYIENVEMYNYYKSIPSGLIRSKLKNRYNKSPTQANKNEYRRNFCVNLLAREKKKFYNNLDLRILDDNKTFWKT